MSKDLFSEDSVVKSNWAKWNAPGDSYQGVYVAKEQRVNTLKGDGSMQTIYTLVQDNGEILKVGGPGGRDLGQFAAIKLGTYVGIKYLQDIEPKKAGYQPSKQVTVFSQDEMKLDVLEQYQRDNGLFAGSNETQSPPEEAELPPM